MYKFFFEHLSSFLSGLYLGVGLVTGSLYIEVTDEMFSSIATPFHMPNSYVLGLQFLLVLSFQGGFLFLTVAILVGVKQYILHILEC